MDRTTIESEEDLLAHGQHAYKWLEKAFLRITEEGVSFLDDNDFAKWAKTRFIELNGELAQAWIDAINCQRKLDSLRQKKALN